MNRFVETKNFTEDKPSSDISKVIKFSQNQQGGEFNKSFYN